MHHETYQNSAAFAPYHFVICVILAFCLRHITVENDENRWLMMQTREAWSQIDVQLKRRNDLLPNLIETVKGYAKYEGDTLAKVTQLRQQVAQASSPAEAMAASDALSRQVAGIFAVAENYPDLKANTNFMQLQEELTNTENKISYARQLYNSVTSNYNVKLETFPTNVIAGMFGFKQAEFLQVPEEEKAVPKVDFSGLGD